MVYESFCYEDTVAAGRRIAERLGAGDVVALSGDLGAGKTALVAGFAQAIGFEGVTSPTFTIVNQYRGRELLMNHLDVYRLSGSEELWDIGFDDLLDAGGITVVEWPERVEDALPDRTVRIYLERDFERGEQYRRITVDWGRERR